MHFTVSPHQPSQFFWLNYPYAFWLLNNFPTPEITLFLIIGDTEGLEVPSPWLFVGVFGHQCPGTFQLSQANESTGTRSGTEGWAGKVTEYPLEVHRPPARAGDRGRTQSKQHMGKQTSGEQEFKAQKEDRHASRRNINRASPEPRSLREGQKEWNRTEDH